MKRLNTLVLCLAALSCGSIACNGGGPACRAGFVRSCQCPNGMGTQTCDSTGSSFSACSCPTPVTHVDLLVEVDNSSGMYDNQALLLSQLSRLMQLLTASSDHVNVGVVSSDLGTPGSTVPGCADSQLGDDGLLNPIRNGGALMHHEPWQTAAAPPAYPRPADCSDPNEYPSFITFDSSFAQDPATFTHDFQCNAALSTGGCGLESQLESVYRALVIHNPANAESNADPNAGFLEDNAVLAILILSDEEDGSVRNASYQNGSPGTDATDVYNPASTSWSDPNLNLRFYLYEPGTAQDPTWTLDRYINPNDATTGWPGLRPGHPERVVFGAITGVPLPNDGNGTAWSHADGSIDWDLLLGAPVNGPNDYEHRDSTRSIDTTSNEGPVSMRQANRDPQCAARTVPSCRRAGSTFASCDTTMQYSAWPSRRIVEVARRFDQAALCNGQPCHNGMVASICAQDYGDAIQAFAARVTARLGLPH